MTPQFPFLSTDRWLVVLRVVLGLYMCAHGATRAAVGTVDDFGVFLAGRGFPLGLALAWGITITEIAGGLTLAAGRVVRPLCAVFVLQHVMGILLVHGPRGWFTVGHQSGGAEYSVLLVVCLLVVASAAQQTTGAGRAGASEAGA
ncbi:MAG: DoxX family protein [Gemmatimonadetes bacterium]|nr:DoxX family protein [Gemmatimonadota bacterium]